MMSSHNMLIINDVISMANNNVSILSDSVKQELFQLRDESF